MSDYANLTLLDLLEKETQKNPAQEVVLSDHGNLKRAELLGGAKGLGMALGAMTDKPVVALFLPMSGAFVTAYFGVMYGNKAVLPLNMLLQPEELGLILKDAGADLIITLNMFKEKLDKLPLKVVAVEDLMAQLKAGGAPATPPAPPPRPKPEDVCTLLYTSGTTGMPKGVELTHANLVANTLASREAMNIEGDFRILACLPTFHTFAITVTMLLPVLGGGSLFAIPRFEPQAVHEAISKHKCDVLIMIPSMYRLVVRQQQRQPLPMDHVVLAVAGGEACPVELQEQFKQAMGGVLLEGYGQTESSPVISINPPDANRPGTIGKPLNNVEVKIVDLESGEDLPVGERGEICTRGPHVMKGYHNRPDETANVIKNGWLHTGDIGFIDADGYITITGREREMVKVGGEMVFPAEVESALLKHDAVFEAGVLGVKDERRGESIKAFVALGEGKQADADELLKHCRAVLPTYKVPRAIEFRAELPKGPTGKVMRRLLK